MTQNGVAAWKDLDGDGIATATLNTASSSSVDSAAITDGSIVGADLNSTIVLPSGATATTQSAADSSTKLATTAFVTTADNLKANLAGPTFTGAPTLPTGTIATTQSAADSSTKLATTAFTTTADNLKADLAGPTFTGTVTLPASTVTNAMLAGSIVKGAKILDERYYMNGSAQSREAIDLNFCNSSVANPGTGVMVSSAIVLYAGDIITSLTFKSGGTGFTNPTHWFFALYDTQATPALIAQTTDQLTTAWASTTVKTLALNSPAPYTVVTSGVYYVSVVTAFSTTGPTYLGSAVLGTGSVGGVLAAQKIRAQSSGSGLTTTAPGTITSASTVSAIPYCVTS